MSYLVYSNEKAGSLSQKRERGSMHEYVQRSGYRKENYVQ